MVIKNRAETDMADFETKLAVRDAEHAAVFLRGVAPTSAVEEMFAPDVVRGLECLVVQVEDGFKPSQHPILMLVRTISDLEVSGDEQEAAQAKEECRRLLKFLGGLGCLHEAQCHTASFIALLPHLPEHIKKGRVPTDLIRVANDAAQAMRQCAQYT